MHTPNNDKQYNICLSVIIVIGGKVWTLSVCILQLYIIKVSKVFKPTNKINVFETLDKFDMSYK